MVHPIRQSRAWRGAELAAGQSAGPVRHLASAAATAASRQAVAGGYRRAAAPGRGPVPTAGQGILLTGPGALIAMLVLFFLGLLISDKLGWMWLAGLTFVLGSMAAARYTNSRDLLAVAVSPPLLFVCALAAARIVTASGHLLVSVAAGSLLTLASVAPWLFAGTAANLLIGLFRGLPARIGELRRDLRAATGGLPDQRPAQPRRPAPQ